MSPSLNCYPEWNNYKHCNLYGYNNSINYEDKRQYIQTLSDKNQQFGETNRRFYQIRNNSSQFHGVHNYYDKNSIPTNYNHHPNWVCVFASYK